MSDDDDREPGEGYSRIPLPESDSLPTELETDEILDRARRQIAARTGYRFDRTGHAWAPCAVLPITAPDGIRDPQKESTMTTRLSEPLTTEDLNPDLIGQPVTIELPGREPEPGALNVTRALIPGGDIDHYEIHADRALVFVNIGETAPLGIFNLNDYLVRRILPPSFDDAARALTEAGRLPLVPTLPDAPELLTADIAEISTDMSDEQIRLHALESAVHSIIPIDPETQASDPAAASAFESAILDRAATFYAFATNGRDTLAGWDDDTADSAHQFAMMLRDDRDLLMAFMAVSAELEHARAKGWTVEHDRKMGLPHIREEIENRLVHFQGMTNERRGDVLRVVAGLAIAGVMAAEHYLAQGSTGRPVRDTPQA